MTSKLYNFIKRQYVAGKIDTTWLDNAVSQGWITEAEEIEILNAT